MLSHLNTKHELIIYLLLINCISRRNECMSSKGQSRMGRRQQKTKDKPLWKKIMRIALIAILVIGVGVGTLFTRSEEHTSELQSRGHLVCRLLLEKTKKACRRALSRPYIVYTPRTYTPKSS